MTDETLADRLAIRDVVESWAIARDSADWDRFRDQWHDDGYMMATWFQGPKEDFIRVSQEGFDKASTSCTTPAPASRPSTGRGRSRRPG
jgi:hypothetical protein